MTDEPPRAFRPRPGPIRDLVRRLATDSKNIRWGRHALERMEERDITDKVAVDVLRQGSVDGEIEPGNNRGNGS
jgi:hypothetical protein